MMNKLKQVLVLGAILAAYNMFAAEALRRSAGSLIKKNILQDQARTELRNLDDHASSKISIIRERAERAEISIEESERLIAEVQAKKADAIAAGSPELRALAAKQKIGPPVTEMKIKQLQEARKYHVDSQNYNDLLNKKARSMYSNIAKIRHLVEKDYFADEYQAVLKEIDTILELAQKARSSIKKGMEVSKNIIIEKIKKARFSRIK